MTPPVYSILPAQLLRCDYVPGSTAYAVSRLRFKVPLQHDRVDTCDDFIELNAYMVYAEARSSDDPRLDVDWATRTLDDGCLRDQDIVLYLCGGPGAK